MYRKDTNGLNGTRRQPRAILGPKTGGDSRAQNRRDFQPFVKSGPLRAIEWFLRQVRVLCERSLQ